MKWVSNHHCHPVGCECSHEILKVSFLCEEIQVCYRPPRLQWHQLQWHSGYSDSFWGKKGSPCTENPGYSDFPHTVTLFGRPNAVTVTGEACTNFLQFSQCGESQAIFQAKTRAIFFFYWISSLLHQLHLRLHRLHAQVLHVAGEPLVEPEVSPPGRGHQVAEPLQGSYSVLSWDFMAAISTLQLTTSNCAKVPYVDYRVSYGRFRVQALSVTVWPS